MNKERLISNINSEEVWDFAKYRYAELLTEKFYGEDIEELLTSKYLETGDSTYLEILNKEL